MVRTQPLGGHADSVLRYLRAARHLAEPASVIELVGKVSSLSNELLVKPDIGPHRCRAHQTKAKPISTILIHQVNRIRRVT